MMNFAVHAALERVVPLLWRSWLERGLRAELRATSTDGCDCLWPRGTGVRCWKDWER